MSEQEDDMFLYEAFKNGASHVLKKPISIDALRIIRQAVMRERMLKNNDNISIHKTPTHEAPILGKKSYGLKKRCHSSQDDDNYHETCGMKKKICVQWTQELHGKFLKVVRELGDGSCFPKDIQERMGVPGLTRMQVASHLQKCRKENLRLKQKQTMLTNSSRNHTLPNNLFSQGVDERKFGCMPIDQNDQEESSTLIGINLSINGWQKEMNNMKNNSTNYRSASMMNISNHQRNNIEKCTPYVPIPFASDLSSNQDDGFGSKASMVTTTNYFQQELPGARDHAGQGFDQHTFPSTSEEFPDFLRDSGGNGPNDI
uniref:two-component response regulator ARR12-like n=1 Tax=Erigeron canadensis TaxID=72917 RepID=UPI001CB98048|nr:two-component response regulator ARR12-like [Erigeron canadensis]